MNDGKRVCNKMPGAGSRALHYGLVQSVACLLLLAFGLNVKAQNGIVNFSAKKYAFIHPDRNEIVNDKGLEPFFEKLYAQKTGNNQRVSVLHIGDSHIQADFLSAQVRTNFQKDFGNGGRGIVVPLRVAGSNEPFNYKITSNYACTSKRCIYVNDPMPIGIGGVTIKTDSPDIKFFLRAFDYAPLNYSFNKLTLFYQKDSTSFDFRVTDTLGNTLGILSSISTEKYRNISSTALPANTNAVVISAERSDTNQRQATIFGINLENDSSGVVYHTVGANGAEAFQYVRAKYFAEQTQVLEPDLIIISLGTNEAQRRPLDKGLMTRRLDSLVSALHRYNPNTAIVFTTPPDSYYHRKYYNSSVSQMHEVIVNYAKAENIAVWDLFSISGGYKSCYMWKKYHMMQRDGLHFTRGGYEFQGNLLYEALIKSYNKYVSSRPQ